ncbi:MAG: anion transporter [Chloroflexi bacterium RBG_13_51_52]|nr:MAG: anion transporter [Chloroflexi bacterium RBG_13_51_52]
MISLITLGVVFVLIAVRQVGNVRFRIWQIMLLGALVVLVSGQITPGKALQAINADVMLFLFGVFTIGQALEESGYLGHLASKMFRRAHSLHSLVLFILFGMGLLSALLMNDTLAIVGTPVVLSLASKTNTQPKILLLSLAFAVTIGSVMSPIGNPQNLLIALNSDVPNPFITFWKYLLVPTLVNLFIAYLLLRLFYRKHFDGRPLEHASEEIKDVRLAFLSRTSLILLGVLIITRIVIVLVGIDIDFKLTYIALVAALPIFLYLPMRPGILKRLDWSTLVFFAAMFVLMRSVWDSGYFQSAIEATNVDLTSTGMIMGVSVVLSQLLSNVPLVALYLPMLNHAGASIGGMMALAAGSTIAGNLTILGAASNVIIIQNAEKKGGSTLTFFEFVRIGVPLTIINVGIYWLFLLIF